jgi:hypothetical protein
MFELLNTILSVDPIGATVLAIFDDPISASAASWSELLALLDTLRSPEAVIVRARVANARSYASTQQAGPARWELYHAMTKLVRLVRRHQTPAQPACREPNAVAAASIDDSVVARTGSQYHSCDLSV